MSDVNSKAAQSQGARRLIRKGDVAPKVTQAGVKQYTVTEAIEAAHYSDSAALNAIRSGPPALASDSEVIRTILAGDCPDYVERLSAELAGEPAVLTPKRNGAELADDWRSGGYPYKYKISRRDYEEQKFELQTELLKLQGWVRETWQRVVILFDGRDAAGKGGTIKRFMEHLNPRGARDVALEKPSEIEQGQWFFQRYAQHLPTAGEMVFFDRSWYNRSGVERVMGFCSQAEYEEFLRQAPQFERHLVRSGIHLVKFWFYVSREEQRRRFNEREGHPLKQWKLSPIDLALLDKWDEYTRAKEAMFFRTDTLTRRGRL